MSRPGSRLAARLLVLGFALAGGMPLAAWAHAPSNATLSLEADGDTVLQRWDIALRDLDRVLPLDADNDGRITWGELQRAWPEIVTQTDRGLRLAMPAGGGAAGGAACHAGPMASARIEDHADGTYVVLQRRWSCPADAGSQGLVVDYRLFSDSDASHRGLLRWASGTAKSDAMAGTHADAAAAAVTTAVVVPAAKPTALPGRADTSAASGASATALPSRFAGFVGFVGEGVRHILIGIDHVLFLLALLLPAVVRVSPRSAAGAMHPGQPALHATQALWQVAKVVTAFTVAHSLTLAMAVLGHANPPARIVESLIAASVVWVAIDNLRRSITAPGAGVTAPPAKRVICRAGAAARWQIAFAFGLIHGFGFAGALRELGLDEQALARSLLGFNLGVELGQLGIVALVMPLAWWVRDTRFYRGMVLAGGSAAIAAVAAVWFVERAFDLALIST
jgi:hypothetical protein